MAKLDPELKALALLVLGNAFYTEYSALVAKYRATAEEFGPSAEEHMDDKLVELSNPCAVIEQEAAPMRVTLKRKMVGPVVEGTLDSALTCTTLCFAGDSISVNGVVCFVWQEGRGWVFEEK